jgi:hypothetical protein
MKVPDGRGNSEQLAHDGDQPSAKDGAPKNVSGHAAFSANCVQYSRKACFRSTEFGLRKTRRAATTVAEYSTVHIGPNNQAGGSKNGFLRPAYQVPRLGK